MACRAWCRRHRHRNNPNDRPERPASRLPPGRARAGPRGLGSVAQARRRPPPTAGRRPPPGARRPPAGRRPPPEEEYYEEEEAPAGPPAWERIILSRSFRLVVGATVGAAAIAVIVFLVGPANI